MKPLINGYSVDISGLKQKRSEYEFRLDNAFFETLQTNLVEKGNVVAKVIVEKSATMVITKFRFSGSVEVLCDRSLEPYDLPISFETTYYFKFGEINEEVNQEMSLITYETDSLDLSQLLYDFVVLQIPMKKLHPKFQNEDDTSDEYSQLIYSSDAEAQADDSEPIVDERWAALKKLKFDS